MRADHGVTPNDVWKMLPGWFGNLKILRVIAQVAKHLLKRSWDATIWRVPYRDAIHIGVGLAVESIR